MWNSSAQSLPLLPTHEPKGTKVIKSFLLFVFPSSLSLTLLGLLSCSLPPDPPSQISQGGKHEPPQWPIKTPRLHSRHTTPPRKTLITDYYPRVCYFFINIFINSACILNFLPPVFPSPSFCLELDQNSIPSLHVALVHLSHMPSLGKIRPVITPCQKQHLYS